MSAPSPVSRFEAYGSIIMAKIPAALPAPVPPALTPPDTR